MARIVAYVARQLYGGRKMAGEGLGGRRAAALYLSLHPGAHLSPAAAQATVAPPTKEGFAKVSGIASHNSANATAATPARVINAAL